MTRKPSSGNGAAGTREERLKAALKANMGRRKAQARARTAAKDAAQENEQIVLQAGGTDTESNSGTAAPKSED